jgi:hypothetical protein
MFSFVVCVTLLSAVVSGQMVSVTAGNYRTCSINGAGGAACWGLGEKGALGTSSTTNVGDVFGSMANLNPIVFSNNLDSVKKIVTTMESFTDNTCALMTNGTAVCFG